MPVHPLSDRRPIHLATWLILAALVLSGGCHDRNPVGPGGPGDPDPLLPGPAIVSNPVTPIAPAAATSAALLAPMVYVSMPSGTFAGGISVNIRNTRTGSTVTAGMIAGGFDPVAVDAAVGDTLEFTLILSGRDPIQFVRIVPEKKPPVIVRTDPPPGKRDVPLNARIVIVFSEPIDGATLTGMTVRLMHGDTVVAGSVGITDPGQLIVEFVPDVPLVLGVDYNLVLTQGIRDQDGDSLPAAVSVPFTTDTVSAPPPGSVTGVLAHNSSIGIYVVNVDGTNPVHLGVWGHFDGGPAWSPDGARLAFANGSTIRVVNADGTGEVDLTSPGVAYEAEPAWSRDGNRIAFRSDRDGNQEIYVINADGTNPVRLTNHGASDAAPAWSPDGSRIAFWSNRDNTGQFGPNYGEIYVMNADGSGLTRLTFPALGNPFPDFPFPDPPTWSPDGTEIAFASADAGLGSIYVMGADGSNRTRLATPANAGQRNPAWSPDGHTIAFTATICVDWSDCTSSIWFAEANGAGIVATLSAVPGESAFDPSWRP